MPNRQIIRPAPLFLFLWPPAAIAAGVGNAAAPGGDPMTLAIAGLQVPVVTSVLAVLGVVLARPIAPKGAEPLSLGKNIITTIICCLIALLWVIDDHPGLLFTFVVAIGLGFAGYSVIELAGSEVLAFISRVFAAITPKGPGNAA
jgi:hypothetical protein